METIVEQQPTNPRGEGYIFFMAWLQLIAGALTLLFSLMTLGMVMFSKDGSWASPAEVYRTIGPSEWSMFMKLMAAYIAFQFMFGWIFGLSLMLGGLLCLKRAGRGVVTAVAVLNLVNFPHGTTVGLLVLHGMTRRGIAGAFKRS
jgi:hypothetical protein